MVLCSVCGWIGGGSRNGGAGRCGGLPWADLTWPGLTNTVRCCPAGEYEARLKELEAERTAVEEDLAQVDRYKTLLLKQRDIMIALTARLNERDEQIVTLQVGAIAQRLQRV